jgi:hypothetical protein
MHGSRRTVRTYTEPANPARVDLHEKTADLHEKAETVPLLRPGTSEEARSRRTGQLQQLLAMVEQNHRRRLLELHNADKVSADLFAEQEDRLTREIEALRQEHPGRATEKARISELAGRFEDAAPVLRGMDVDELWEEASEQERRVLVEELLGAVSIFPDHLEVTVAGVPRLNVTLEEVGLKAGVWQFGGVGGGI